MTLRVRLIHLYQPINHYVIPDPSCSQLNCTSLYSKLAITYLNVTIKIQWQRLRNRHSALLVC